MTDARRAEIESWFERALEVEASSRAAWLERSCHDAVVREAVRKLLAAHVRAGVLERPLSSIAADLDPTITASGGAPFTPEGRVGVYEILDTLGRGGMGVVMRARDTRLDRVVAMKFLSADAASTPGRRARFTAEAKAASTLDHPAVARVYDVGETPDGHMYLVMACCAGRTLDTIIAEGAVAPDAAREVALGVASGLACAHRAGIIHRDIKPSNVMVGPGGAPKILDFGIAKVADAPAMTRTGTRLGTAAYMSPEQARGERVDPRTDIWSLGVVLYEMVTGVRPFAGRTPAAVVEAILTTEPEPPISRRPDLPPALDHAIRRALAKPRQGRYPDVSALVADLDPGRDTAGDAAGRLETLSDEARHVLGCLSVFESAFGVDEAEAAVAKAAAGPPPDVLEAMDELLAASLVRRVPPVARRSRFVLSETVRALARGSSGGGEANGGRDQTER